MSPSRSCVPLAARIGMARSCSDELNAPPTRTCTASPGACTAPADSTAFCWPSAASTWGMSSPSTARRFCEISTYSFSSCTPNSSTLFTSFTRSRRWRTSSATCFRSAGEKPSPCSA
ncbi:hypothetical protein FQZ97_888390 [compost metagenome]